MTVKERKAELRRHAAGLPQMEAGALFERFLALPEVEAADTVMEARQVLDVEQLAPNRFGIPEPDQSCPVVPKGEIAAALIPHLMVDREGYRLGWGGGYYDRWLADFTGFTACVCRPGRLLEHMPREEFDVPVKLVLIDE